MATAYRKAFCALILAILLITPSGVWAWGNTGHEAVAYIAWQQMTPAARTRAIALLAQVPTLHSPDGTKIVPGFAEWKADLPAGLSADDQNLYLFMRAATWADTIKHTFLQDSDTPPPNTTTDVNLGFSDPASHGYWHFIDTGFASDASTVPPTPVPNVATQIVALRQALGSNEEDALKAYDMIWLEHLVGDIHQPLHGSSRYFNNAADIGGNLVKIRLTPAMQKKFEGTLSKSAPTELHAFWDSLPGEGQPAPALPQAARYAKSLAKAVGASVADTDPADWASESFNLAKQSAYRRPIGKSPTPPVAEPPPTTPRKSYLLTPAYYTASRRVANKRIALAGARLAVLLNGTLQ